LRDKPRAAFPDGRTVAFSIFSDTRGRYLALQVGSPPSSSPAWTTTALLEPTLLDLLLAPNSASSDAVALMQRGGAVIATSGAQAGDIGWLPKTEAITENYAIVNAPSRSGASFDYATAGVLGEQYYILRRFDTSGMRLAWLRFLVLSLAPLATLATLYIVYSWAIQSEILRWIEGIKLAILARRRGQGERAFAPMDVAMPTELRDFASTFNEMARESAIREDSLKRSLTENEFLLRELHHRVKNSLQIIQSYLSLTRRLDSASSESIAIAAMEARVQVLSIAYRKAFSEGRMRDVRIRLFAEELTRNLAQSFRRPGLSLELDADITTALMIDRAIPMGLALVEAVMAGLRTSGPRAIRVALSEGADRRLELRITTDGALPANMPDGRLMSGLALQLGAEVEPCGPGEILHWRFQGAPPPMVKPLEEAASRPVDVVETRRPQRLA